MEKDIKLSEHKFELKMSILGSAIQTFSNPNDTYSFLPLILFYLRGFIFFFLPGVSCGMWAL